MQTSETRALQHLTIQGFTIYTCAAAVCTRLVAPSLLDDPEHTWAVVCDRDSQQWLSMLPEGDPLAATLGDAALRSAAGHQHAVCHTLGGLIVAPLDPGDEVLRRARVRIEGAITLGKQPPTEKLEAFSDELIEREAARRAKRRP
jgi:hypothetical protein